MVADEDDLADQRHAAVVDLVYGIDAVLIEPDDLRIDAGVVVPALGIHIDDLLPVLLGQCRREHRTRAQLHLRAQLIVIQLVVALEGDAIDERVLHQAHDEVSPSRVSRTSWNRPVA